MRVRVAPAATVELQLPIASILGQRGFVATRAGRVDMAAHERIGGLGVSREPDLGWYAQPQNRRVAALAALAEVRFVHGCVATDTSRAPRRRDEVAAIVALRADRTRVSVGQAEPRMGVALERDFAPIGLGVAVLAGHAELPGVRILVAARAARKLEPSVLRRAAPVAISALDGRVRTAQRIARAVVVECVQPKFGPRGFIMAGKTFGAEAVFMGVLVAARTSLRKTEVALGLVTADALRAGVVPAQRPARVVMIERARIPANHLKPRPVVVRMALRAWLALKLPSVKSRAVRLGLGNRLMTGVALCVRDAATRAVARLTLVVALPLGMPSCEGSG